MQEYKQHLLKNPIALTKDIQIEFVNDKAKLCYACHAKDHLIANYEVTKVRTEVRNK